MEKHVLVLKGGWSPYRPSALLSGRNVAAALAEEGFRVTSVDVTCREDVPNLIGTLGPGRESRPDVVFMTWANDYSLDGRLQAVLDLLRIPYCYSGHLATVLANEKHVAKRIFKDVGIPVARHVLLTREEAMAGTGRDVAGLSYPFIVKPTSYGFSLGVRLVRSETDALVDNETSAFIGKQVMAEEYIPGQELTVSVVRDAALEPLEIVFAADRGFYDRAAKVTPGAKQCRVPADVPAEVAADARRMALLAHRALGCRGASRADFRYDGREGGRGLVMLEVNAVPGITPQSDLTLDAERAGISFRELVRWMVDNASYDE